MSLGFANEIFNIALKLCVIGIVISFISFLNIALKDFKNSQEKS